MKKLMAPIFSILIAALLMAILPTEAEAAIYDDTVRLHILANSDSREDQALKLALRDAILAEYGALLSGASDAAEAAERLRGELGSIERFAAERLRALGSDYAVRAELATEWYDTREYAGFALPRGSYRSLKITIGSGAGHNWWCVMFPPLCLDIATEAGAYSDEENALIAGGKYRVKFKILELASEIFS